MIVEPYSRIHKVSGRVQNCISELESIAITPKRLNELSDAYEMEHLVDNIKLNLYQEYKSKNISDYFFLNLLAAVCYIKTLSVIGTMLSDSFKWYSKLVTPINPLKDIKSVT